MSMLVRAVAWVLFFNAAIVGVLLVWEGWRRIAGRRRRGRHGDRAVAGTLQSSAGDETGSDATDRRAGRSTRAARPSYRSARVPGSKSGVGTTYRDITALQWSDF